MMSDRIIYNKEDDTITVNFRAAFKLEDVSRNKSNLMEYSNGSIDIIAEK